MHVNGLVKNNHLMLNFGSETPTVTVDFYKNWLTGFFMCIFRKAIKLNVTTNNSKKVFYVNKNNLKIKSIKSFLENKNNYSAVLKRIDGAAFKILIQSSLMKTKIIKNLLFYSIFSPVDFETFKSEMKKCVQKEEYFILKSSQKSEPVKKGPVHFQAKPEGQISEIAKADKTSAEIEAIKIQIEIEVAKLKVEVEANKTQIVKLKLEAESAKSLVAKLEAEAEAEKKQKAKLEAEAKIAKLQSLHEINQLGNEKLNIQEQLEKVKAKSTCTCQQDHNCNDKADQNTPIGNANKNVDKSDEVQKVNKNEIQFITRTTVLKLASIFQGKIKAANKNSSVSLIVKSPVKIVNKTPEITSDVNVKAIACTHEMTIIAGLLNNLKNKQKEFNKNPSLTPLNKDKQKEFNNKASLAPLNKEKIDQKNKKESFTDAVTPSPSPIKWIDKEGHEISNEDQLEIVKMLQEEADEGNAEAQYQIAMFTECGLDGYQKNLKKALELYQSSALQGHAGSKRALGEFYEEGKGVPKDLKKAIKLFEEAANQGDAVAQFHLGVNYENGTGVVKDLRKALNWYELAANQGDAAAQFNLASMYESGTGVEKDLRKALKWYEMAASQGDEDAIEAKKSLEQEFQESDDELQPQSETVLFTF